MALRNLIVALAVVILTATPAFARGGGGGGHVGGGGFHGGGGFRGGGGFHGGGGFRGGGGFHGSGEFRGGRGFHGRNRFDRFHRFGFFGDFGFVGPVVGFGFGPFFWDPFWFPAPYPVYTYAPPLVIQPEPGGSGQQAASPAITYWYYCAENNGYYPYTQQCPGSWRKVPTTPMG